MRLFNRKSQLQRLLETVNDSLERKTVKTGLIAAGGLAGLTAGSAAISSLRRRGEAATDGS
jgi:hypothetical protein